MSKPDKATIERFSRTLRELVKRPENKVCADCKRNDPRWASWNLGVFLCIRCSGIHRGMGTHISKVKSVDLDVWTPEQMDSIQKWGNRRANLYWEAHLKQGHTPPEHKMESFIRSKYESRRWALDGPPPADPSVLESGSTSAEPVGQSTPSAQQQQAAAPTPAVSTPTRAPSGGPSSRGVTTRQPQPHQLLSTAYTNRGSPSRQVAPAPISPAVQAAPVQPAQPPPQSSVNDLFSLDFHAPPATPTTAPAQPRKDVKQDIMSLFSATPATTPSTAAFGQFNSPSTAAWGSVPAQPPQQAAQPTSMIGAAGIGAWGASSGWNAAPAAPPLQSNVWATPSNVPPQQASLFNTNDIWGGTATSAQPSGGSQDLFSTGFASSTPAAPKKDDVFGDLWGGFK